MKAITRRRTAARLLEALIKSKLSDDLTAELTVLEMDDAVLVSWEGGPFEWAPALTGGSCIFAGEFGNYSEENSWYAAVLDIQERYAVFFECQNSFQISVWEA